MNTCPMCGDEPSSYNISQVEITVGNSYGEPTGVVATKYTVIICEGCAQELVDQTPDKHLKIEDL